MESVAVIMEYIRYIKVSHPELRVGQILVNAAHKAGWENDDIFYCPDEMLKKGLIEIAQEIVKKN